MSDLTTNVLHLGLGATATVEPEFDGMPWYEAYSARHAADGIEGRLVSQYSFAESWTSWVQHPLGAEVVICTAGSLTLHKERPDGGVDSVTLASGDYAINPPGVTATATAIFITPGEGTEHRLR